MKVTTKILIATLVIVLCVGTFLFFINNHGRSSIRVNNQLKKVDKHQKKSIRKDKTIIRVCQSELPPKSLDPITNVNKQEEITFHVFDRIQKWDEKGNRSNDLAEQQKWIAKNTMQIKLKKGIKFHNGEPFDAESVKFSIDRILDLKTKSPIKLLLKSIKRVEIVDPYTVNIHTSSVDCLIRRKLSFVQMLPPKYFKEVGAEAFSKRPVGTSSYMFDRYDEDGSIVLKKNPNYWGKDKPNFETIVFKFIKTDSLSRDEQLQALYDGEIDLLTELPGIHTLKVQKHPGVKLVKSPDQSVVYKMLFNSLRKPFSDIKLRKAVNLALNRDLLIKVLAKGNGRKIATNSVEMQFGHNPNLKPYPYDLKEAKRLMKEAGIQSLDVKVVVTEESELIARAIAKDLKRININVNLDVMTKEELAYRLAYFKIDPEVKWDYDLAVYYGIDPLMHVGFIYEETLYSKGSWSTTNNKEVDVLIDKLKQSLDKEEQLEYCYKLEEMAYNNYWYTPIFQVIGTYGAAKDLNFEPSASSYLDLEHAYFD